MTVPKVNTIKRGGSRFYVDPDSGAKVPGVTSVVGMLPKGFLMYWAAKMAAEFAVDNLAVVNALAAADRTGAIDLIKGASRRYTAQAGETGTAVHGYFEERMLGKPGRVTPDIADFVPHVEAFLDRWQPEVLYVEDTVWSDTHGYAGSFDAIVNIEGETVVLDAKTSKSGVHAETALQLAAYRYADRIVTRDNVAVPELTGGAVLHLRPEGYKLIPIACGEREFEFFLTLRQVFEWEAYSKGVIGKELG
jgi:hypothetical protein